MLGDFPRAVDDAILGSHEAHQAQMMQLLSDPNKAAGFAKVVFEMLQNGVAR
jgi:type I restriction enzyme R subunit